MLDIVEKYKDLTDHAECLNIVLEQLNHSLKSDYPVIEIGTYRGGSAMCFLEVMKMRKRKNWFYTVDPYGQLPYHDGDRTIEKSIYGDNHYREAMFRISDFCHKEALNHHHFKCTSEDFMDFYYPNFTQATEKLNKFAFVYLDGSHEFDVVKREIDFFAPRLDSDCCLIIDDVPKNREKKLDDFMNGKTDYMLNQPGIKAKFVIKKK